MRNLSMKLSDGEKYKFRTLTRKQMLAVTGNQREQAREMEILRKKEESDGLDSTDMEKLLTLEDDLEILIMRTIRLSLAIHHPEFKYIKNEDENDEDPDSEANRRIEEVNKGIDDQIEELMDIRDIRFISTFAMTGELPQDEAVNVDVKDIEL